MKRSAEPQDMLERYRASLSPRDAVRDRVWDELAPRAAAGEPPSLPAAPSPPAVPVPPAGLAWSPALVSAAVGASALLVAAVWSWRAESAPSARPAPARELAGVPVVEPRAAAADAPPPPPQSAAPAIAAPPQTATSDVLTAGPEQVAPRARARRAEPARDGAASHGAATPAVAPSVPASGETGSAFVPLDAAPNASQAPLPGRTTSTAPELDEELRLLRGAYEALRSERPKRALSWLDQHAARFPRGALAEARDVARIMALCQAGQREAARAEAAQFIQRAPRSPHAGRVRSLCADTSESP